MRPPSRSFGQPKARCTCYTQCDNGQASASFCWMCCPDPSNLRMRYWDEDLKSVVAKTNEFLDMDETALWEAYSRPHQNPPDEQRRVAHDNGLVHVHGVKTPAVHHGESKKSFF